MDASHEDQFRKGLNDPAPAPREPRDRNTDAEVRANKGLLRRLHETQEALAEKEAWLQLCSEAGEIGFLEFDIATDSMRCNHFFNETLDGSLGSEFSTAEWLERIHPDDRKRAAKVLDRIRHSRNFEDVCTFECRALVDGTVRWFEYHGKVQRGPDGAPVRAVGAVHDITRRKEAQFALEEAARKMEGRVAQRTRALHRQALQLRRLTAQAISSEHRERKRLAALLHDHLQQFLVAAKLQLHFVQNSNDVDTLRKSIQRSVMLLEESIEIARGLSRELRPPILYEQGLIPALRWLADDMLEMHGLRIAITAAPGTEPSGDDLKSLLFECVRELLFNVVKYAGVAEAAVDVRRRSGDSIQITVSDNGAGFNVRQRSFGVGMLRIRERLASIGGGVEIDSAPGHGTRVLLRAPLDINEQPSPLGAEFADPQHPASDDDRIRVLLVDDHRIVREGIASMLESPVMSVAQAADGLEAIDAVEAFQPHVVLMDLNMPRMNGLEATRIIHERWPDIAIIGLSVQDDEATARSLTDAGANAFVPKGGDADMLLETILTVI